MRKYQVTPLPPDPDSPPPVMRTALIVATMVFTVAALIALGVIALR